MTKDIDIIFSIDGRESIYNENSKCPNSCDESIINNISTQYNWSIGKYEKYIVISKLILEIVTVFDDDKIYYVNRHNIYLFDKHDKYYGILIVFNLKSDEGEAKSIYRPLTIDCSFNSYEKSLQYIIENINSFL